MKPETKARITEALDDLRDALEKKTGIEMAVEEAIQKAPEVLKATEQALKYSQDLAALDRDISVRIDLPRTVDQDFLNPAKSCFVKNHILHKSRLRLAHKIFSRLKAAGSPCDQAIHQINNYLIDF